MIAKVRKWGNSLGLRIPKSVAKEARIELSSEVDLAVKKGRLVVTPLRRIRPTLGEMLRKITPRNLHGEAGTGGPRGREEW